MPKLKGLNPQEPIEFELTKSEVTIGRTRANMLALKDPVASSRHAVLRKTEGGWQIEDMGSRNGTFVNDEKITLQRVANGDRIKVGDTEFLFEDDGAEMVIDEASEDAAGGAEDVVVSLDLSAVGQRRAGDGSDTKEIDVGASLLEQKLHLIELVSEKLVRIQDDKKLTEEILSLVIKQLKADRGFLCMLNENQQPVPLAKIGLEPGQQPRVSRTVLGRLLQQKAGVVIKPQQSEEIASLMQSGVSSTMYAPLWTGENIIGFLCVDSTTPGRSFNETDLNLVLTIAHQAAVGLERTRLTQAAEKDRQVKSYLSKYLDAKIVQSVLSAESGGVDPLAPQEREVTVLFSDIVSFTKMSEGLPPTTLAAFIREYLTTMTDIIFSHGGTIDKYIGDAIMALFGAPLDNPAAAVCAIRAALEMKEAIRPMKPPKEGMDQLRVRFGINTGHLTVGNLGSSRRVEYTALGDTVNVASRLQTFARPDEIVISEMTYSKPGVEGQFAVEQIGAVDVKNRAQPVKVYKVLRASAGSSTLPPGPMPLATELA